MANKKELLEIIKEIYEELYGSWDEIVISEEMYERMQKVIKEEGVMDKKKIKEIFVVYNREDIPEDAIFLAEKIERADGMIDLSIPNYNVLKVGERKVYIYQKK